MGRREKSTEFPQLSGLGLYAAKIVGDGMYFPLLQDQFRSICFLVIISANSFLLNRQLPLFLPCGPNLWRQGAR